jgi:hypothetical protein
MKWERVFKGCVIMNDIDASGIMNDSDASVIMNDIDAEAGTAL